MTVHARIQAVAPEGYSLIWVKQTYTYTVTPPKPGNLGLQISSRFKHGWSLTQGYIGLAQPTRVKLV